MKKTKFMSLIAILLMFVVALTCGFFFACGSDDEGEVTDQGTVEEDPTTPTDPTESTDPTEPTDPTDSTEPSEGNEDVLVSIYDGTAENFGGNNCYADFRNLHELTVEMTTAEDGSTVYAIEGMATLMTKSQIYAFNAGENEDGAKTGDAFIIVEIAAPEGSTINYNGVEVEVTDDPTDGVFIQKITEDGEKERSVTITYTDETTVSFVISLEGVTIPSDYIIGTWSNAEITAQTKFIVDITATASAELIIGEDGTYTLVVSNISAGSLNLAGVEVTMTGEWTSGEEEGTYTLTGEEDNEVTVTLSEDGQSVQMSFSIEYYIESLSMSLPITVEEQTLYAGALEVVADSEDEE